MASGSYMPPYGQPPPPYQASQYGAGGSTTNQHFPLGATASAPMNPQSYQTPMSKIEIHISCRFVTICLHNSGYNQYFDIGSSTQDELFVTSFRYFLYYN